MPDRTDPMAGALSRPGPTITREDAIFTHKRLRIYSIAFAAGALLIPALMLVRGAWLVDPAGAALPTDFLSFWSAGYLALHGHAAAAYDFAAHRAVEAQAVGVPFEGYFSWFYVPTFFTVMAPLGALPYVWAFCVWVAGTLIIYLVVIWAIVPGRIALALALAWPPAVLNLVDGQTGFAMAALLGGALVLLDQRPAAAGVLLGLLTFKPQFGILIPLVLLSTGRWRVIVATLVTASLLAALTLGLFGSGTWEAFIRSAPVANDLVLERGGTGWSRLQSVYALARWLDASSAAAWSMHAAFAAAVCLIVVWIWLRPASYELQAASLSVGAVIVTPYVLFYDLAALAVPIAFLVRYGLRTRFLPYERTLLALLPLITIPLPWLGVLPLGVIAPIVLFGLVVAHQRNEEFASS